MLNTLFISFILYATVISIILYIKPNVLFYNNNIKRFGTSNNYKTIIPLWLVFMLVGIISYVLAIFLSNLKSN